MNWIGVVQLGADMYFQGASVFVPEDWNKLSTTDPPPVLTSWTHLAQRDVEEIEIVMFYMSKYLAAAKQNYSVSNKEHIGLIQVF